VKAVFAEDEYKSLEKLNKDIDWSILQNAYVSDTNVVLTVLN
jgi:hypothetical protein